MAAEALSTASPKGSSLFVQAAWPGFPPRPRSSAGWTSTDPLPLSPWAGNVRKQALGLSPEPAPLASEHLLSCRAGSEMSRMDPGNPLWDLKQAELRSVGHVPVVPLTSCGVLGQPPAPFGSWRKWNSEYSLPPRESRMKTPSIS